MHRPDDRASRPCCGPLRAPGQPTRPPEKWAYKGVKRVTRVTGTPVLRALSRLPREPGRDGRLRLVGAHRIGQYQCCGLGDVPVGTPTSRPPPTRFPGTVQARLRAKSPAVAELLSLPMPNIVMLAIECSKPAPMKPSNPHHSTANLAPSVLARTAIQMARQTSMSHGTARAKSCPPDAAGGRPV